MSNIKCVYCLSRDTLVIDVETWEVIDPDCEFTVFKCKCNNCDSKFDKILDDIPRGSEIRQVNDKRSVVQSVYGV